MGKFEQALGGTNAILRRGDSTGGASINDDVLLNTVYGAQLCVSIDDYLMEEKGGVYPYTLPIAGNCGHLSEHACRSAAIAYIP